MNNMFARRAAASEGSHARDEAKMALKRLSDRQQKALSDMTEKIGELQTMLSGTKNSAVRSAIASKIEQQEHALADMREQLAKLEARTNTATSTTIDVLAEISAHEAPLGRPGAHLSDPTRQDIRVPPPDPSVPTPKLPSQSAVVAQIYRDSPMTYAGGGWVSLRKLLSPSNMLTTQTQAMETRLGRPLKEQEMLRMKQQAKANAMASAAVLVGTFCCFVAASFAGLYVWRQYGKPRSSEQLSEAQAKIVKQQNEREARLRDAVGPVVSKVKVSAETAIAEHEGLSNLATGLSQTSALKYIPPPAREAELRAAREAAEARAADEAREAAEAHAKIVAAEAAWQQSGGKVMGEEDEAPKPL